MTFTPPRLPQVVLTRVNRAFVLCAGLIFMFATFATRKETRSHCFPAIQMFSDETDNADLAGDKNAWFDARSGGSTAKPGLRMWRNSLVSRRHNPCPKPKQMVKVFLFRDSRHSPRCRGSIRWALRQHRPFATCRSNGDYAANAAFHTVPQATPNVLGWA